MPGHTIKYFFVACMMFYSSMSLAETNYFKQGNQAFKKGKYDSALFLFLQAEQSQSMDNSLIYNIGVTYYKLKDYRQANRYFLRLTQISEYRQLAYYNMGRSYVRLGKTTQAKSAFTDASKGTHTQINRLARIQLDKLDQRSAKTNFDTNIQLSYGDDSNVFLNPSESPSQRRDQYLDLYVYTSISFPSDLTLTGTFSKQDYMAIDSADYQKVSLALSQSWQTKTWRYTPQIRTSLSDSGNSAYLSENDIRLTAAHALKNKSRILLRYRYSNISARQSRFDHLTGDRHQFRAEYKTQNAKSKYRYRYQLELNDRQDRLIKSYSPTRHSMRFRIRHSLTRNWRFTPEIDYRNSDYPSVAGIRRVDNLFRVRLASDYRLSNSLKLNGQYIYNNNDSNVFEQKYIRHVIEVGISYYF